MKVFLAAVVFLCAKPVWAAHAYSQFGDIKYPPGFTHFEWVNPNAPKGGEMFKRKRDNCIRVVLKPGLTGDNGEVH